VTKLFAIALAVVLSQTSLAQKTIALPTPDGAVISANLYGSGSRAVLLVHGGRFTKESWALQIPAFTSAGFQVMAIDLRGFGHSRGPGQPDPSNEQLATDVLTAVHYLHTHGAATVSIVGGSMGGAAAADASIASEPGEIDRIVLLGAAPSGPAEKLKSPALFIVARDDTSGSDGPRLPGIRAQYEKAPPPKRLIVLAGSAHAQFLFQTAQSDRVLRDILQWLSAKYLPTN
jgi:pimeloyl-ACP methyl ester carboxylesterase